MKKSSRTPRFFKSASTATQNLADSAPPPGPFPQHASLAGEVHPDRGAERLVADLTVTDLNIDRVDKTAA